MRQDASMCPLTPRMRPEIQSLRRVPCCVVVVFVGGGGGGSGNVNLKILRLVLSLVLTLE